MKRDVLCFKVNLLLVVRGSGLQEDDGANHREPGDALERPLSPWYISLPFVGGVRGGDEIDS